MKIHEHRRYLITGATSGIGLATSRLLLERGARICVLARDSAALERIWGSHSADQVRRFALDVTQNEECIRALESVDDLNGLVHCAGSATLEPVRNVQPEDFDRIFGVHVFAPVMLTLSLIRKRRLLPGSSVVFLSSTAADSPSKAQMLYAMAKATLPVAATCLTSELSEKHRIRFNAIQPGILATDQPTETERILGKERLDEIFQSHPLGKGNAEDVARLASFLLSDESRWISGTTLTIDGGRGHHT